MGTWDTGDWHLEAQSHYDRSIDTAQIGAVLRAAGRGLIGGIVWLARQADDAYRRFAAELTHQRIHRATAAELGALDDRTLADIGVHRAEIPWIAEQMVRTGGTPRTLRQLRGTAETPPKRAESRPTPTPVPVLHAHPAGCG